METRRMSKNKRRNQKRILKTTALGLSLSMTSVLLYNNVLSVHASPVVSADEETAINTFLNTQPVNGDSITIATTNPSPVAPITYTFPGLNHFSNAFLHHDQTMTFDQDYLLYYKSRDSSSRWEMTPVKVKDWNSVVWYKTKVTPEYNASSKPYGQGDKYYARKITVINQNDNTEFELKDVVYYADSKYLYASRFAYNLPLEEDDPRFTITLEDSYEAPLRDYQEGYWNYAVSMNRELPYDTIVQIDESLKTNETVIDQEGRFGEKSVTFEGNINIFYREDDTPSYNQYSSDVIYNGFVDLFNHSADGSQIEYGRNGWGGYAAYYVYEESENRIIRVGIDYTHYVTEDGTELQPKVYGLQAVENIADYEYVSTRTEANGDRVHVYKKNVATSLISSSPKTGDTNLFQFAAMLVVGMLVSITTCITRNKNI